MADKRILVVDDDPDQLFVIRTILGDNGVEILEAEDTEEARKLLASEVPDLVITDLMMPNESGFSLLSAIKEKPSFAGIPVIVLSSMDAEAQVFKQGAEAFLAKPFDGDELQELVSMLLTKKDLPRLMEKAASHMKNLEYGEARYVLEQILAASREGTYAAHAAFYLAEMSRVSGRGNEAVAFYKKAIQFDPTFWRALTQLGRLAHERRDLERALSYWKQSLEIKPDQPDIAHAVSEIAREIDAPSSSS